MALLTFTGVMLAVNSILHSNDQVAGVAAAPAPSNLLPVAGTPQPLLAAVHSTALPLSWQGGTVGLGGAARTVIP